MELLVETVGVALAFGHVLAAERHDFVEGFLVLRGEILRRDLAAVAALLEQQPLALRLKRRPRIRLDGSSDSNIVFISLLLERGGLDVPLGLKRSEACSRQAVDLADGLAIRVAGKLPQLPVERPLLVVNRVPPDNERVAVELLGVVEVTDFCGLNSEFSDALDQRIGHLREDRGRAEA